MNCSGAHTQELRFRANRPRIARKNSNRHCKWQDSLFASADDLCFWQMSVCNDFLKNPKKER